MNRNEIEQLANNFAELTGVTGEVDYYELRSIQDSIEFAKTEEDRNYWINEMLYFYNSYNITVVDCYMDGDEVHKTFSSIEEADDHAEMLWNHLTDWEKERHHIYTANIRHYKDGTEEMRDVISFDSDDSEITEIRNYSQNEIIEKYEEVRNAR